MVKTSIAATALLAAASVSAIAVRSQTPLQLSTVEQHGQYEVPRKLHGRFLHITDIHPDDHYKPGTKPKSQCHRGKGVAGPYGAEKGSCDTPWTLVNETFRWIDENLKDQIDFVIWTGDSARHDKDVKIPRTPHEIYGLNERTVNKMVEVFGNSSEGSPLTIPIVPTLGNNDIFPHNIMQPGPSKLTKAYVELWKRFIPEDQYHIFYKGAYFWQQVVPGRNGKWGRASEGGLAVFSLNTLYFFNSNTAVDGCNAPSEPGYEQMEWLNVQLSLMRERGMKAIIIGHVPPVWTKAKMSWDKSCWKKYVLWSRQYRDVIVGHLYGHMNLDHFTLLDSDQLKPPHLKPKKPKKGHKSDWNFLRLLPWIGSSPDTCSSEDFNPEEDPDLSVSSAESYLNSLREAFAQMVLHPVEDEGNQDSVNKHLGGKWAERYVLTHVSPSVVPNYFPTLRVVEYNITDLVDTQGVLKVEPQSSFLQAEEDGKEEPQALRKNKDKMRKPDPPPKTAPPGPAYSMQPYTFIGYTQYFLNLTKYNNPQTSEADGASDELRKRGVRTENGHAPKLQYEVEYDTHTDRVYKLKDLTVRSYVGLARRIVDASPRGRIAGLSNGQDDEHEDIEDLVQGDDMEEAKKKKQKKKKKKKKKHDEARDKVWHAFVKRAFVGTVDGTELERFEARRAECAPSESDL